VTVGPPGLRVGRAVWSAPGRVNLIGEHTDYNDGFVLPFAIEARTRVSAERRRTGDVVVRSAQANGCARVALADLDPSRSTGSWADYAFGVVWALARLTEISGLALSVDGEVPLGSGLSSSAALECAVAGAVDELFSAGLSRAELARACRQAENEYVGVPCGVMDQAAVLLCVEGHALFLDTRNLETRQVPLAPADEGSVLLLIDTGVRHELASSAYAERRRDCERAAGRLGVRSLRDVSLEELEAALGELDDPRLVRRVRHVVSENGRVLEAVRLLEGGRLGEVGELLTQSHRSLRDDYEVSCAELDLAVDAALSAGALGARMTGGGFGGFAIALADAGREHAIRTGVSDALRRHGRPGLSIEVTHPSAGARSETRTSDLPHL
jgi:galactokinase